MTPILMETRYLLDILFRLFVDEGLMTEIRDEAQFVSVFGRPSEGIDWTAFRILVVQLTTTCKLQKLESVIVLSGIFMDADGIYIGLGMTQYGPCQGDCAAC